MKYETWIVVLIVTAGCGGPDFSAPLFGGDGGSGGEGGGEWSGSSSSGSASSSEGPATSSSAGGSAGGSAGAASGGGGSGTGAAASSSAISSASSTTTSGTGGGGGAEPCGPDTCAGCCDAAGECQVGSTDAACGQGGQACTACTTICGWDTASASTTCPAGEWTGTIERWCNYVGACEPKIANGWYVGACCPGAACNTATGACPP